MRDSRGTRPAQPRRTLDPLSLLILREEWSVVAQGLEQRARVLHLALSDLFGPQTLITRRVLPQDMLYAHLGYLPLRRGSETAQGPHLRMLSFYAADLGRSPDGKWWAMTDPTESPSGAGFALEHRIVVSRMLPEPLRECRAMRLAGDFREQRKMLESIATEPVCRNPESGRGAPQLL